MPALLLVLLSLALMLWRVAAPFGQRGEGRELLTVRLGLRERVLYHRTGLYCFAAIMLLLAFGRLITPTVQLLAVGGVYAVLMLPVRYRFTTAGVGVNNVVFRRWSEFGGVEVSARSLMLQGLPGNGRLMLRLLAAHQAQVLPVIRRHLRSEATATPKRERKGGRHSGRVNARTAR